MVDGRMDGGRQIGKYDMFQIVGHPSRLGNPLSCVMMIFTITSGGLSVEPYLDISSACEPRSPHVRIFVGFQERMALGRKGVLPLLLASHQTVGFSKRSQWLTIVSDPA